MLKIDDPRIHSLRRRRREVKVLVRYWLGTGYGMVMVTPDCHGDSPRTVRRTFQ